MPSEQPASHASSSAVSSGGEHRDRSSGGGRSKYSMFGPYRLLRTLGEGEFGKVKLAVHKDSTKEVAIKLIKKENIETPTRRSKLMREISILQSLDHPFIVKLIEVIETDHYIGMIMEFASGGELFEHILAHRYLKEREACRFFAQLIAGVAYVHNQGIVHRDLKLENLLLDGNRNIVITDFGFANVTRGDDSFLQTSCGSPCYAAPELVISDGYVGEAADIWSCGVILYAMLCGYLPFDDDPANPDGENINLLYKYILETELDFPEYVSDDARLLLQRMLVPDPKYRAKMPEVMAHRWLSPAAYIFEAEKNNRKHNNSTSSHSNVLPTIVPTVHPTPPVTPTHLNSVVPDTTDMDVDEEDHVPIGPNGDAAVVPISSVSAPSSPKTPTQVPLSPVVERPPSVHTPKSPSISSAPPTPRSPKSPKARPVEDAMEVSASSDFVTAVPESVVPISSAASATSSPLSATPISSAMSIDIAKAGSADTVSLVPPPSSDSVTMSMPELAPTTSAPPVPDKDPSKRMSQQSRSVSEGNILARNTDVATSVTSPSIGVSTRRRTNSQSSRPASRTSHRSYMDEDSQSSAEDKRNMSKNSNPVMTWFRKKSIKSSEELSTATPRPSIAGTVDDRKSIAKSVRSTHTTVHQIDRDIETWTILPPPRQMKRPIVRRPMSSHERPARAGKSIDQPRPSMNGGSSIYTASTAAVPVALEYHMSMAAFSSISKNQKFTYHSGPIDQRALTSRDPVIVVTEIVRILLEKGMEVRSTGIETGEFKIKVVRPASGDPDAPRFGPAGANMDELVADLSRGVSEEVGRASIDTTRTGGAGGPNSPGAQRARSIKERKRAARGAARLALVIASLPVSLVKRVRYIAQHGPSWAHGFDGRTKMKDLDDDASAAGGSGSGSASSSSSDLLVVTPPTGVVTPPVADDIGSEVSASEASYFSAATGTTTTAGAPSKGLLAPPGATLAAGRPSTSAPPPQKYQPEIRFNIEMQKIRNLHGLYVVDFKRIRGDIWAFKRLYHTLIQELPLKDLEEKV